MHAGILENFAEEVASRLSTSFGKPHYAKTQIFLISQNL